MADRAPAITESANMDRIVDAARQMGWVAAHFRPAQSSRGYRTPCQYDAQGWPDLVLVHESGDMLYAELKTWARRNDRGPGQQAWLDRLARTGADVYVWTERDWEAIVARLAQPSQARVIHALM